jgi:hypothetical protein
LSLPNGDFSLACWWGHKIHSDEFLSVAHFLWF